MRPVTTWNAWPAPRTTIVLAVLLLSGCARRSAGAHFMHKIDWIGRGQWLKADLHAHTKFSDGGYTVAEVVDKAAAFGCQVVAITDHADRNLSAATQPYFAAIDAARKSHPHLIILAGLEWNVPPFGGNQHANVFLATADREGPLLAQFKESFDDLGRNDTRAELADEALRWLAENGAADGLPPVVLYNHPSRKRESSTDIVAEIVHWRQRTSIVAAIEGGPGHQRNVPLGSYIRTQPLIDRWDPAVARMGDAWDQLLSRGIDIGAALTNSDFHTDSAASLHDYWPGEFAETWLYVGEHSRRGVLQALREGAYFGVHGQIARAAEIRVFADGLPRPAQAGEQIAVPANREIRVRVGCQVPAIDWEGKPNSISSLELIVIDDSGVKEIDHPVGSETEPAFDTTLKPSGKGMVLRARGRRQVPGGPDLMFYTNSVRITVM
jgi:hypothetical protein